MQANVDDQRDVIVKYITTPNGDWSWNLLMNIFTEDVLDKFVSIQPPAGLAGNKHDSELE